MKKIFIFLAIVTVIASALSACGLLFHTDTPGPTVHASPSALTSASPLPGIMANITPAPPTVPNASDNPSATVVPVAKSSLLTGQLPILKKWPPIKFKSYPPVQKLPGQKVAYLTFDDGPSSKGIKPTSGTANLLAILEAHSIHGTFFMIGKNVYDYPELARRVAADGNVVGNHTWSHISFHDVKENAFKLEVEYTNDVISDVIGVKPTLLRPPGGNMPDSAQREFLREEHLILFLWNVDTRDWAGNSDSQILDSVQKGIDEHKDLVILFHDYAFGALDQTIDLLQKNGYGFDTLNHYTDFHSSLVEH